MPNLMKAPFDGGRKLICRRDMCAHGRKFKRGATFGWRRLAITERRARLLYEAGWLGYEGNGEAEAAAAEKVAARKEVEAAAEAVMLEAAVDVPEETESE